MCSGALGQNIPKSLQLRMTEVALSCRQTFFWAKDFSWESKQVFVSLSPFSRLSAAKIWILQTEMIFLPAVSPSLKNLGAVSKAPCTWGTGDCVAHPASGHILTVQPCTPAPPVPSACAPVTPPNRKHNINGQFSASHADTSRYPVVPDPCSRPHCRCHAWRETSSAGPERSTLLWVSRCRHWSSHTLLCLPQLLAIFFSEHKKISYGMKITSETSRM